MRRTQDLPASGSAKGASGLPANGGARGALGFTMIEVMVVMVILAILSSIAIPGFSRWLPNYRLKGAARDFYSNLQLAKSGAIRDRADWAVELSGNTYIVTRDGSGTPFKTVNLTDYGSNVSFGAGSSTPSAGAVTADSENPVVFNSRGFTTNEDPILAYLTNSRNTSYAVGTLVSGAVVLRKWNGSGWE